jgi:uncharacterized protein (DUF58 family)
MLTQELRTLGRRVRLRAKKAVTTLLGGTSRSFFKGAGLAFEEVRPYQPGDDIRRIDWNVTARTGQPFVKRFIEERELNVILLLDVSRSLLPGSRLLTKRYVLAEVAAVLTLLALQQHDRIGLLLFTDRVEKYLPPAKAQRHGLRLIHDALFFRPEGKGTNLTRALHYLQRVVKRRSVVCVLSDFLDKEYETPFKLVGRRNDLIAVQVSDPRETSIPKVGWIRVQDAETGTFCWLDTSSVPTPLPASSLTQLCKVARADLLSVSTDGQHLEALIRFLQQRAQLPGQKR